MKKFTNRRLISALCSLALIFTCGFGLAVQVYAAPTNSAQVTEASGDGYVVIPDFGGKVPALPADALEYDNLMITRSDERGAYWLVAYFDLNVILVYDEQMDEYFTTYSEDGVVLTWIYNTGDTDGWEFLGPDEVLASATYLGPVWATEEIYDEFGDLVIDPLELIPLDGMTVVEWNGNKDGFYVADGHAYYVSTSTNVDLSKPCIAFDSTIGNHAPMYVGRLHNGLYYQYLGNMYYVTTPSSEFEKTGIYFTVFDSGYTAFFAYYPITVGITSVSVNPSSSAPYYPGMDVQFNAEVMGTGIVPGTPESTVYWYVHGNNSVDTFIDNDGLLTIANDETSLSLEVEAISTYDSTKSASVSVPVTYPLNLQITPAQSTLITSAKRQEIQFELLLPNGQPFDYSLIEWSTPGADGQYFRIDDNGLLEILPGAPAGSVTVKYAYQHDTGNVSTTSATVTITTQQEGIYDQLTPTPEQSDKADQMEDAIGDAAGKLEHNNSSLGQLTPTRPQINTDLQLDPDKLLAVSPLVTNIWSISGLQSLIGIVVLVATVAYIFFGKRDG